MKKILLSLCLITAFANSSEIPNSYTDIQNAGMELADKPNARALRQGQLDTQKIIAAESAVPHVDQSNNGQFSNAFPEKGNRLFSYYLTKAFATKENLDLDTLSAEVYANVKEESLKMGDMKRQEPQIEGNRKIGLK